MNRDLLQSTVRRMARSIGEPESGIGDKILIFLKKEDCVRRMIAAAEEGIPPAAVVSASLLEEFGPEQLKPAGVRRFIGWAIRAVLAPEGFEPDRSGVKTARDPLFTVASTYRPLVETVSPEVDELLSRFLDGLTPAQLSRVRVHVDRRLGTSGK